MGSTDNVEQLIIDVLVKDQQAKVALDQLSKQWVHSSQDYQKMVAQEQLASMKRGIQFRKLKQDLKDAIYPMEALQEEMKGASGAMLGLGLNMMFTGQQIERSVERIAQSSIKAFLDMERGQTASGKALLSLSASFEFLKFSIGEAIGTALAPLMPYLMGLIDWVSAFVKDHPKLTAFLLALVGIVGTLARIGGQVLTWAASMTNLLADSPAALKTLGSMKDFLTNMAGLTWDGVKGFFSKIGDFANIGWDLIKASWKYLLDNPLKAGLAAGLIAAIMVVAAWLSKVADNVGGWGELFKDAGRGILRVIDIIAAGIGAAFGWAFEKVIDGINLIISAYNFFAGLAGLPTAELIPKTGLSLTDMYGEILQTMMDTTDSWIGAPKKGYVQDWDISKFISANWYDPSTAASQLNDNSAVTDNSVSVVYNAPVTINNNQSGGTILNPLPNLTGNIPRKT